MKYDYLRNQKHKPRKAWWNDTLTKHERSKMYHSLLENPLILGEEFASKQFTEKDLFKHTILETLPFNVTHYLKDGKTVQENSFILVHYDPTEGSTTVYSALSSALDSKVS